MDRTNHIASDRRETNAAAIDRMLPRVYADLRALAAHCLRAENRAHTLQPTALVHEAVLRLMRQNSADWHADGQLLAVASMIMRHVLVDHARAKRAIRRGGPHARRTQLDETFMLFEARSADLLAVEAALERLAKRDERKARIVELRFFGGLSNEEVARALGISERTVGREWQFARSWLHAELSG